MNRVSALFLCAGFGCGYPPPIPLSLGFRGFTLWVACLWGVFRVAWYDGFVICFSFFSEVVPYVAQCF